MDFRSLQLPPPALWQEFESLCLSLFQDIWGHPTAQKNGRSGQPQHGVDVHGYAFGNTSDSRGVQCKGKDGRLNAPLTRQELLDELAKAEQFRPPLKQWILATTAPSDAKLQELARELSEQRGREGKFSVQVLGWGDLEQLLGDRPSILRAWFPGLAPLIDGTLSHASDAAAWSPISAAVGRDIGPALLGRSLGPGDALACPRLPEAGLASAHLRASYSARLVGDPGAGKSVCAFQVAHDFATAGWSTYFVDGADGLPEEVPSPCGAGTLLLIDDAHLVSQSRLKALEAQAHPNLLVLSTHNSLDSKVSLRGAIRMDPVAGIRVIAEGLFKDRITTLAAVRRADSSVGDQPFEHALEDRIEAALSTSQVPWQFCFVLGGGWRRAGASLTSAKALGAELTLCAIAARQVASRDAKGRVESFAAMLEPFGVNEAQIELHIRHLAHERLIVSTKDVRCPHQAFASVLLETMLSERPSALRADVQDLMLRILASDEFPLVGQRNLLAVFTSVRFNVSRPLLPADRHQKIVQRCWVATEPAEITASCLMLWELSMHVQHWEVELFSGREETFAGWLEANDYQFGHAMGRLTAALYTKDTETFCQLRRAVDPLALARRLSEVDVESAWATAELLAGLYPGRADSWTQSLLSAIDRPRLIDLARHWPSPERAQDLAELIQTFAWPLESFALDMFEAAIPVFQRALLQDATAHCHPFWELGWRLLRLYDPVGGSGGRVLPPASGRQKELAQALFKGLAIAAVADGLSTCTPRQLHGAGHFIFMVRVASPRVHEQLVKSMDWARISDTIGDEWTSLPHHAQVLLSVAAQSKATCPVIAEVLGVNLHRIAELPMRLYLVAPELGIEHLRRGGKVVFQAHGHVDWLFAPYVISHLATYAPDLIPTVLAGHEEVMAKSFSHTNGSSFDAGARILEQLEKHAPQFFQAMLDRIPPEEAEVGWRAARKESKQHKDTVKVLARVAAVRQDRIGELARSLRGARGKRTAHGVKPAADA